MHGVTRTYNIRDEHITRDNGLNLHFRGNIYCDQLILLVGPTRPT